MGSIGPWDSTLNKLLEGDSSLIIEDPNIGEMILTIDSVEVQSWTVDGIQLFNSGQRINRIYDEDDMVHNSDTALATQQSIKAYVDNSFTAFDDDRIVAGDSSIIITDAGTGQIDVTVDAGAVGQWLAAGLTVTGTVTSDGLIIGDDEQIKLGTIGIIESNGNAVLIRNAADTEIMAAFWPDGAVKLYHNNAIEGETTVGAWKATNGLQIAASGIKTGFTGTSATIATGIVGSANLARWNSDGNIIESSSAITDGQLTELVDGSTASILHKHPATYITVADADGYYVGAEVETALQELGKFKSTANHSGFVDVSTSTLSVDAGTPPTITLTPDTPTEYWIGSYVYTISSPTILQIADTTGSHFIYIDAAGDLQELVNPSHTQVDDAIVNKCLVAWIYWETNTNTKAIVADERHGMIMSGETHHWLHDNISANYKDGLGLTGYTLDTASDVAVSFEITNGEFYDEDIEHIIIHAATAAGQYEQVLNSVDAELPVLYKDDVDSAWIEQAASTLPYILQGGDTYPSYNNDDGDGTWSLIELGNQKFMIMWIIATNDWQYPIKMVCGSEEYNTAALAQIGAAAEVVNWGTMPAAEFVVLYQLIIQAAAGGTKSLKITDVTDYRSSALSGGSYTATDHGSLGGLSDDDHVQYLLASDATSRAVFVTNWTDLTDGGTTTLHSHTHTHDHGAITGLGDDDHTQYILHSLATAANDFLIASGSGAFIKKTLAEAGAILEGDIDHGNLQGLSTGADHSYIDQDVTSGASPLFGAIMAKAGETGINLTADGPVELYHDNVKTLSTVVNGISVLTTADGHAGTFAMGANTLYIYPNEDSDHVQIGGYSSVSAWTVMAGFDPDGIAYLNYAGSTKLSTSNTGISVTGVVVATGLTLGDNQYVTLGAGPDATIYSDGANLVIGNGATDETLATFTQNGAVKLYYDNAIQVETVSGALKATNAFIIGATTQVTGILDEDNLGSDSAVSLATQQSIKAYVDAGGGGGGASDRHGFSDISDQTRLWTPGTNTYTITKVSANWECWIQGDDFVQTAVMSSTIAAPVGGSTYYFYLYDNAGTLTLANKTSWTAADYEDKLLCHQVEYTNVWANYFTAVIDNTKIDADLTNFPCLITVSTAAGTGNEDLSAVFDELTSDANRKKIKVTTDSQGVTDCYAEIERWDDANEVAYIWVRVPSVASGADTTLYVWYDVLQSDNDTYVGDVASTPGQAVWDVNYIMVYHLHEDPTGTPAATDSTGDHDLTMSGTMLTGDLVDGQVGKCLDFDGTDDYLYETNGYDPNGDTACTMEVWGAATTLASNETLFINHSGTGYSVMLFNTSGKMQFWLYSGGNRIAVSAGAPSADGSFEYYAGSWQSGEGPSVFIDEAKVTGTIRTGTLNRSGYDDWIIGDLPGASGERTWEGRIDEVRYSNIKRSDAWLKATYNAGADTLIAYGATTATGGAAGDNYDRAYEYFDHPSERVVLDQSSFVNVLSSSDTDLQAALETIDGHAIADHLDGKEIQGRKNIIINGDTRVWQRGTSFAGLTNGSSGTYLADRWGFGESGVITSVITVSKDTTDLPTGEGFDVAVKIDCTTPEAAVAATEAVYFYQIIEAVSLQHINYGQSAAKALVLSFWLKSDTKSGTMTVALYQEDDDRTFVHEVTVTAGSWQQHSITITGDTTGEIDSNFGAGIWLLFSLYGGSDYQTSSLDVWNANSLWVSDNQDNFLDSAVNNLWITGVQLEVGSVVTDFERLTYGESLTLCQRYFCKSYNPEVAPGTTDNTGALEIPSNTGGKAEFNPFFPVTMRAEPTVVSYSPNSGTAGKLYDWGSTADINSTITASYIGQTKCIIYTGAATADDWVDCHFTADAEL